MENDGYARTLADIRREIDAIDGQLLPLLLRRMDCSTWVAEEKKAQGLPVYAPAREREILDRVSALAGPYSGEIRALWSALLAVSRDCQHRLLGGGEPLRQLERTAARRMPARPNGVLCQGVGGAYSHQAALDWFGPAEIRFAPTWQQVFEEIREQKAQFGVLPVENSAAGSVTGVYDLILRYRFYIVGAQAIRVEHCLAAAAPGPVDTVVSHPQALSQCRRYLAAHGYGTREYSNTAAAAEYVSTVRQPGLAAICSQEAARQYGLTVLEDQIQDEKNNRTRFVVISRDPILPAEANKISLCFSLPHEPGSLYGVLQRFAACGLNMTKIESRPIPGSDFEYDFYLDFTGNIHDPPTLELICSLHDELPRFSFLGNYAEP